MSYTTLNNELDFEDELAAELGVSAAKKKKRQARRSKIKKGLKAVATGGLSVAVGALKKTKLGKKVKSAVNKTKKVLSKPSVTKAKKVLKKVETKKAGDCKCKDEMAKLVAAKLVAQLGPPLDEANKILARMQLQTQATYEHKKIMSDHEFRRKVLEHIADKARSGNKACKRTLRFLRG